MDMTQVVVLTQEELKRISDGEIYAFVNTNPGGEILLMSEERCERWKGE